MITDVRKSNTLKVIKRDGKKVPFNEDKIGLAIKKGFDSLGDKYKPEDLLNDVTTSLAQIEKELGHEVEKVFTYPCGLYSEEGRKLLEENGIIQNLTDSKINQSKKLNLYGLHRMYALEDPAWKILLKIEYRHFRYGG